MSDNKRDDGGPAFPVFHAIDGNWQREPKQEFCGMTLRDWFAGQALTMFSAAETMAAIRDEARANRIQPETLIANAAYTMADAMLKERAK